MPNQDPMNTSSMFSLNGIREQMKEKKNGTLKTTKMNASIAAKIRTKAINNSSIIKVTLKQNNKALALALNAAKKEARELTKEKMLLQKEVKLGDFEKAHLRQKLSAVVNLFVRMFHKHHEHIEELQQFMNSQLNTIMNLSSPSEDSCPLLPFDGRCCTTERTDNQDNETCPIRTAPKAMKIPLVHKDDKCAKGPSDLASTNQPVLPLQLPTLAVGEPSKNMANPAAGKPSSCCLMEEPLANSERNGQPSGEIDGTAVAFDFGSLSGGNSLSIPQSSRSCSLSMLNNNNNLGQHSKITRSHSDQIGLSSGHVTERKKHTNSFSASFRDCPWMELSVNGPAVGLILAKEMEPPEISQMGDFVTLKAQNKTCAEAKERKMSRGTEGKEKMSRGTEGKDSSAGRSEGNLDNCSKGAVPSISQPKTLGINTMSTDNSAEVDHLEKIQPQNNQGPNKGHSSQCFSKTVGPPTIPLVSPYRAHDLTFSENSGGIIQHTYQHSDKTGGREKIAAINLVPRKCTTNSQEPKNKACTVKLEPRSLESFPLLGSPPSVLPVSVDDAFSDGECRKWLKTIPNVQEFSTIQNTTLIKTSSSSLEKTCLGVRSHVTDLKSEEKKPKANGKARTGNNLMDLSLDSHHVAQSAKGQKTPAGSSTLPKTSAVVHKNDAKQVPSGSQKTTQETPKESFSKIAPHPKENKTLKDLTNATQSLCHSAILEKSPIRRGTRARKPVTYEEPKLNRKLRRGDPLANSDFFSCPIDKARKKKITKSEAKEHSSNPVP